MFGILKFVIFKDDILDCTMKIILCKIMRYGIQQLSLRKVIHIASGFFATMDSVMRVREEEEFAKDHVLKLRCKWHFKTI